REIVMLGLVTEGAGHAATGAVERLDLEPWDELQRGDAGLSDAERLLVTVAMQHRLARQRRQIKPQPYRGFLFGDELVEELCAGGERPRLAAGQQSRELIAQGEETGRLEADDRHAALDEGRQRRDQAPRLDLRFIDEAGGKEGAAAAEGSRARPHGPAQRIAGSLQHALRGARVLRLEPTVEGIDKEHGLAGS